MLVSERENRRNVKRDAKRSRNVSWNVNALLSNRKRHVVKNFGAVQKLSVASVRRLWTPRRLLTCKQLKNEGWRINGGSRGRAANSLVKQ